MKNNIQVAITFFTFTIFLLFQCSLDEPGDSTKYPVGESSSVHTHSDSTVNPPTTMVGESHSAYTHSDSTVSQSTTIEIIEPCKAGFTVDWTLFKDKNLQSYFKKKSNRCFKRDSLDLSSHKISNISGLEQFSQTDLKELDLSFNSIKTIEPLSEIRTLTSLKLEHNLIQSVTPLYTLVALEILDLRNNEIVSIDLNSFKNLTSINIANNKIIQLVVEDLPELRYCYANTVTHLTLSNLPSYDSYDGKIEFDPGLEYSNIKEINLYHLPLIDTILLKGRGWKSLESVSISDLPILTEVDLSSNNIAQITFSDVPKLSKLNLHANELASMEGIIENTPELTELDISQNILTNLTLDSMNHLTKLIAYENEITQISLSNMVNLIEANVSYNQLNSIVFSNLPNLEKIHLQFNKLSNISSLFNVPKLTWVNLEGNFLLHCEEIISLEKDHPTLQQVVIPHTCEEQYLCPDFSNDVLQNLTQGIAFLELSNMRIVVSVTAYDYGEDNIDVELGYYFYDINTEGLLTTYEKVCHFGEEIDDCLMDSFLEIENFPSNFTEIYDEKGRLIDVYHGMTDEDCYMERYHFAYNEQDRLVYESYMERYGFDETFEMNGEIYGDPCVDDGLDIDTLTFAKSYLYKCFSTQ